MKLSMRLFRRKTNGIWYFEVDGGQRRSLKTRNKADAKRLYNQFRKAYLAGKVARLTGQCTKTLGEYRDEFLEWAEKVQGNSTYRANRLALDKLAYYAGDKCRLDRISLRHTDSLIADAKDKGLADASINNYIRHARASLAKAVEWEYVQKNPLSDAKEIKERRKQPVFMEKGSIPRFIGSIEDIDLRRMVVAYLVTGRRRSELLRLDWKDIDLKRLRYVIRHSKDHLERTYAINSMFHSVLLSIGPSEEGRIFPRWKHPDTISHIVKQALVNAGHLKLNLHTLRHTFANIKAEEGHSLKEIQDLLGHSEIKATQIYTHLTDNHLADISEVNIGPVDLEMKG